MIRCEELPRTRLARRTEDLLGRPLLEDHSVVEEAHALRDVAGEAHLVGRDQHRHSLGGELSDDRENLGHELGIERARYLVQQEEPWIHRERAHDRDPLLLPAGEPVRVLVPLVREAEAGEQLLGAVLRLVLREPERLPWAQR